MARLIELQPETRAERLGAQAERHDTAGRCPIENVALLKQAGYFTAPIPDQFGGLGVDSVHDLLVASSRLARGDPSTTLGPNMHLVVDAAPDELRTMFAEVQAAKTFVNDAATRIVDRALTLSGGAGYMRSHALSRAYRDVRAGGFMQPLGSVRAYEYLAQAATGPGTVPELKRAGAVAGPVPAIAHAYGATAKAAWT